MCYLQSLAEKGGSEMEKIVAEPKFLLLATMNPGGDFGKKELSPALRNRFTEIWVPPVCDLKELKSIALSRYVSLRYTLLELLDNSIFFVVYYFFLCTGCPPQNSHALWTPCYVSGKYVFFYIFFLVSCVCYIFILI